MPFQFQSTRPRGRTRPARSFGRNSQTPVSIHASSREDATCSGISGRLIIQVSIHASSREDATTTAGSAFICFGFNPRVLAGGRDLCVFLNRFISVRFQSTRPRGRTRQNSDVVKEIEILFQSTRPRGRTRHVFIYGFERISGFNPRVLAGGRDFPKNASSIPLTVSIHASSREDATIYKTGTAFQRSFNPRVLAGGRDRHIALAC